MKTSFSHLASLALLCLAASLPLQNACAQRVIYYVDEIQPVYYGSERIVVATDGRSDYQPHLAREYRTGYWAGRQDSAYGFPRNSVRAFRASGGRWESYFQEGYADGYDGRPMNH